MLKLVFLTKAFYDRYKHCPEIEQKENRPYARIEVELNGVTWAIPLRSHINHSHAIWTDKENGCGIDLSKAVVIEKPKKYISSEQPYIRDNEFRVLKRIDEYRVAKRLQGYIDEYKKAKQNQNIPRNRTLVKYSTLQYFEKYL